MFKLIPLFFLLILTSCDISPKEQVKVSDIPSEYSDQNIRQITGFMEVLDTDKEYPILYDILTRSEKPCIWKDFVGYRECFLIGLWKEQEEIVKNTQMYNHEKEFIYNNIALFEHSLRQEVSYLEFYKEIDDLPTVSFKEDNSDCRLAWYRAFDQGSFTWQHVTLSYLTSQRKLSQIFLKAENFDPKSLSWVLLHENPCKWNTWWPDPWYIFHFSEAWKNQYFFIKTADGGWSGDFNYTIYHNHGVTWEEKYTPIATFPAFSWFTPTPQIVANEEWNAITMKHRKIMEEFKNRPFQYITLFEDRRMGYIYQIARILDEITP